MGLRPSPPPPSPPPPPPLASAERSGCRSGVGGVGVVPAPAAAATAATPGALGAGAARGETGSAVTDTMFGEPGVVAGEDGAPGDEWASGEAGTLVGLSSPPPLLACGDDELELSLPPIFFFASSLVFSMLADASPAATSLGLEMDSSRPRRDSEMPPASSARLGLSASPGGAPIAGVTADASPMASSCCRRRVQWPPRRRRRQRLKNLAPPLSAASRAAPASAMPRRASASSWRGMTSWDSFLF